MRYTTTLFLLMIFAISGHSQLEYPTTQAAVNPFLHPKEISANREIVLIYDSQENNNYFTNQKFYDVNTLNVQDLNTTIALNTSMPIYPGIQSYGNRHIGQATGDFNDDGRDDYVVATEAPNNKINLGIYSAQAVAGNLSVVPDAQLQINGPLNSSTSSGESRPVGWIKLGCGDFNGDGDAEIVVLYRQHTTGLLSIEIYDVENGTIVFKGGVQDETADVVGTGSNAYESFDMSVADLDFDGISEVIVASSQVNSGSRQPYVKVYRIEESGASYTCIPKGKVFVSTTQSSNTRMPVSLAVGDFNNDLIFEIVLAYGYLIPNNSGSNPDTFVRMFRVANEATTIEADGPDYLEVLELLPSVFSTTKSVNGLATLDIDAGDMDGNGSDDLVLATGSDIEAFFIDANFNFSSQGGVGTFTNAVDTEYDQYLVVADMNNDGRAEIVNVRNWQFDNGSGGNPLQRFSIVVHKWNTVQGQFEQLAANSNQIEEDGYTSGDQRQFVIGVGDFDGDEISFGDFERYLITNVQEPILILNAPPTHQDNIGPADWVDVNSQFDGTTAIECGPSIANYEAIQTSETTVSTTYSSAWTLGAEVSAELDFVVASISASISSTYGESYSNSLANTQTFTVTNTYNTCFDDAIYAATLNYEVFEYPIYAGDSLVTYLLSIHPLAPTFGWVQNRSNMANGYLPSHEAGNLLSYRPKPQVGSLLGQNRRFGFLGYNSPLGNEQSWSITTATNSETTAENSYTVDVETSASASAFGVALGVNGSYSLGSTSTRAMSVGNEVTMGASVSGSVVNSQSYSANAVLFWGDGGALTLDYEVDPSGSFYFDNYSQQDPALNMPWRLDVQRGLIVEDPTTLFQCKSISLSKANPQPGDTVVVSLRIYNYSLVDIIDPIEVSFFMGNPLWNGVLQSDIDGETVFTLNGGIPAQGFRSISMTWVAPQDNQLIGRLYAQLDPNETMNEIHEENNVGYLPLGIYYLNDNEVSINEINGNQILGLTCYPNPAKDRVNIGFHLTHSDSFRLEVYDLQGRLAKVYPHTPLSAGFQERSIDVSELPKGMYVLKMTNDTYGVSTKLVID
jgi:hypothetical protein